jgi:hypothetical protein
MKDKKRDWIIGSFLALLMLSVLVASISRMVEGAKPSPNPTKLELINSFTQKEGLTVTDYGREDAKHYWVNVTRDGKSYIMIVNKDYVMEYYNAQK